MPPRTLSEYSAAPRRHSPASFVRGWALLAAVAALTLTGCRQDMHDQAKYEPLEASPFFADGASSRRPVEGTVARGQLREDRRFYGGVEGEGQPVTTLPLELDQALLQRGHSRYEAFCSPCHGRRGDGYGMIVRRGFKRPESFHSQRLRDSPVGYYYNVISNGFGQMSSYASQIAPRDRWAITAYVRALQLARNVPVDRLSDEELSLLRAAAAESEGSAEEQVE